MPERIVNAVFTLLLVGIGFLLCGAILGACNFVIASEACAVAIAVCYISALVLTVWGVWRYPE